MFGSGILLFLAAILIECMYPVWDAIVELEHPWWAEYVFPSSTRASHCSFILQWAWTVYLHHWALIGDRKLWVRSGHPYQLKYSLVFSLNICLLKSSPSAGDIEYTRHLNRSCCLGICGPLHMMEACGAAVRLKSAMRLCLSKSGVLKVCRWGNRSGWVWGGSTLTSGRAAPLPVMWSSVAPNSWKSTELEGHALSLLAQTEWICAPECASLSLAYTHTVCLR